eukprot:4409695-Prymnesium_polylepis.2
MLSAAASSAEAGMATGTWITLSSDCARCCSHTKSSRKGSRSTSTLAHHPAEAAPHKVGLGALGDQFSTVANQPVRWALVRNAARLAVYAARVITIKKPHPSDSTCEGPRGAAREVGPRQGREAGHP